jgi:adenylylsulfate kinase (apsK)
MIIQFCGLSGSGKTTLALKAKEYFSNKNIPIEIIDADEYRKFVNTDIGFSKEDRNTNIRRLGFIADKFSRHNIISIISAINPYDEIRKEIAEKYLSVKTVYIKCSLEELKKRDTKGLYAKADLPDESADKVRNLSGLNDPFETPENPDLVIETDRETVAESTLKLVNFIKSFIF